MAKTLDELTRPAPTSGVGLPPKTYEHDPANPWVAVSNRSYAFSIAADVFGIKGRKARGVEAAVVPPVMIMTEIGITFLAAEVAMFSLLDHPDRMSPPARPPGTPHHLMIRTDRGQVFAADPYVDSDNKPVHAEIEKVMLDAFVSKGWGKPSDGYEDIDRDRFVRVQGEREPAITILRIRDLFGPSAEAQRAMQVLQRVIPFSKRQDHVGGLHDFAVCAGVNGGGIVEACRRRARQNEWRGI